MQALPDIYCAASIADGKPKHIMEWRDEGEHGAGYYCRSCDYTELEKDRTDEMVDSQIARRVLNHYKI